MLKCCHHQPFQIMTGTGSGSKAGVPKSRGCDVIQGGDWKQSWCCVAGNVMLKN